MNIFGFIGEYCQDLVADHNKASNLVEMSEFPHDDIVIDSDGKEVPVVYIDGVNVPVNDFFTYSREDFVSMYKNLPSAAEMYDNYLESFTVVEGEEALMHIRNLVARDAARLEEEVELVPAVW